MRSVPYLLLRLTGSVVALSSVVALFSREHVLQALSRYAVAAGMDQIALTLVLTDAGLTEAVGAVAPWVSAALLLCVLLVIAVVGRPKHGLASAAALLLGVMAYCPPIEPLAWGLLVAVFAVPAVFVIRAHGFANTLGTLKAAASALAAAVLWALIWPELLRRSVRRDRDAQPRFVVVEPASPGLASSRSSAS